MNALPDSESWYAYIQGESQVMFGIETSQLAVE